MKTVGIDTTFADLILHFGTAVDTRVHGCHSVWKLG